MEVLMTVILRLQCDPLLGGRVDRETADGMVAVASVVRKGDGLLVHLRPSPASAGLEYLEGLRAEDCERLQVLMGRGEVTVTMPSA
jgi:hypothetical protein